MPELIHKRVEFDLVLSEFQNLVVYRPRLPLGEPWAYLGPVAFNVNEPLHGHSGLIVLAEEGSNALQDIVDWEPVFVDVEQRQFSTWRGIPQDPATHTVVGEIFVTGTDKPTKEQTAGIKAIRRDLVDERQPHHLVWECRLPRDYVSLWDTLVIDGIHIATGAFVSTGNTNADDLQLGLLRIFV